MHIIHGIITRYDAKRGIHADSAWVIGNEMSTEVAEIQRGNSLASCVGRYAPRFKLGTNVIYASTYPPLLHYPGPEVCDQ